MLWLLSQRAAQQLVDDDFIYIKDRQYESHSTWRCGEFYCVDSRMVSAVDL